MVIFFTIIFIIITFFFSLEAFGDYCGGNMPLSQQQMDSLNVEALKDKALLVGVKKEKIGPWERPHIYSKYTGK